MARNRDRSEACAVSLFVLSVMLLWQTAKGPPPLEALGRLDVRQVPEASGIVKSRRHPGIFWVHNDSGNAPLLFAIRSDGRVVRQFRLEIPNIDWEDIAIDDRGHLYIGDIGNNLGALPMRAIYRIDEPDPAKAPERPLAATALTRYVVPRDNRFDAESLDYDQGNAIVIAKYRDGREAEIFSVPFDEPAPLSKPAQPKSIGRLAGFVEPATGSDLDVERTHLAVCSSTVSRIYRREDVQKHEWKLAGEACWSWKRRSKALVGTAAIWCWLPRWGASFASPRKDGARARRDHSLEACGWVEAVTRTLPAADMPRAMLRRPSRQTIAPDSGRFSRISPDAFNSRPLSLR